MAIFSNQKHKKANPAPILIVENKAEEWLLIRSALAQCFPEVAPHWMNNATQMVRYLENALVDTTKIPRLILIDLYLPNREDGLALLTFIKNHPFYHQIPVVFLSHSQNLDDIIESYNLGIASYIVKPGTYHLWLACFSAFRNYWWNLAKLPERSLKPVDTAIK